MKFLCLKSPSDEVFRTMVCFASILNKFHVTARSLKVIPWLNVTSEIIGHIFLYTYCYNHPVEHW